MKFCFNTSTTRCDFDCGIAKLHENSMFLYGAPYHGNTVLRSRMVDYGILFSLGMFVYSGGFFLHIVPAIMLSIINVRSLSSPVTGQISIDRCEFHFLSWAPSTYRTSLFHQRVSIWTGSQILRRYQASWESRYGWDEDTSDIRAQHVRQGVHLAWHGVKRDVCLREKCVVGQRSTGASAAELRLNI